MLAVPVRKNAIESAVKNVRRARHETCRALRRIIRYNFGFFFRGFFALTGYYDT